VKRQLLAAYRAAVARYSEALSAVSFAFDRCGGREQFQAHWNELESHRTVAEEYRRDLLAHLDMHRC